MERAREGVAILLNDVCHSAVVKSGVLALLVKRDMVRYVQSVKAVRGMGCGLSDHHVVPCKVRLVGART